MDKNNSNSGKTKFALNATDRTNSIDNQLVNMAMNIVHKNESLKAISKRINELRANPKFNTCFSELYDLQIMINRTLQLDKERDTFELIIKEKNDLFYKNLKEKYPRLTSNEVRLCALIRLDFSSKEIASILNISVKSVEMNRYRLRKKLQLGSNQNLPDFINSL